MAAESHGMPEPSADHNHVVLSRESVTTWVPPGLKAAFITEPSWPEDDGITLSEEAVTAAEGDFPATIKDARCLNLTHMPSDHSRSTLLFANQGRITSDSTPRIRKEAMRTGRRIVTTCSWRSRRSPRASGGVDSARWSRRDWKPRVGRPEPFQGAPARRT